MRSRPIIHWIVFGVLLAGSLVANLIPMERPALWWRPDGDPGGVGLCDARGFPFCYEEFVPTDEADWIPSPCPEPIWQNFKFCVVFSAAMMLIVEYWARRRFQFALSTIVIAEITLAAVLLLNLEPRTLLPEESDLVTCRGYGWPYAVYYENLDAALNILRRCIDDSEYWIDWGSAPLILNIATSMLIVTGTATLFDAASGWVRRHSAFGFFFPGPRST